MERRDFIKHSAAVVSVVAADSAALARSSRKEDRELAGIVLVDERFSDSRRFASALELRGAKVVSLAEDIGRLWYGELGQVSRTPRTVIAGLTLHTDLFISQLFARENGRRLVEFGMHDCRGVDTVTHTLNSGAAIDLSASESWPEEIAASMLQMTEFGSSSKLQRSCSKRAVDHPGSLYSWIIV